MEYILIALVAFVIGWKISNWISAVAFKEILEDLGVSNEKLEQMIREKYSNNNSTDTTVNDGVKLDVMEIKIEEHEGRLYAYRVADNRFLAQGADRESLIESLTQNLTNVRLIVSEDHGSKLLTKET
jgi:hypothetical protein